MNVVTEKIETYGEIDASTYPSQETYWKAHLDLIMKSILTYESLHLVIEDYFLYAGAADAQINSRMETPKMIGVLQYYAWENRVPTHFQTANSVKTRWSDYILSRHGYLEAVKHGDNYRHFIDGVMIHGHIKDSIRHAVHYMKFFANK